MSHMVYVGGGASCADGDCGGGTRIVSYTAIGDEAGDFMVDIGATLALDTYYVGFFAALGVSPTVPDVWAFPDVVAGDRTTSQFRVTIPIDLVAGEVFQFQIVEA